ncbi:hypothetical protein K402DRAFT_444535 [Aulographum hederae CBS 113979]|uniref:magnesium chelatase n=1 Tax=Aulographum hederae CBS 113979 TaxID=1176131 RepID=A0A6G1H9Y5_9PEZI|nr:hypothetical protein K402DRAFT_444535 [Aulographum hederae CBS 113979]
MDGRDSRITDKVQSLSDIELAALLCLVADQHCILESEADALDELEEELKLICRNTFGLTSAVLECSEKTSIDEFGNGILIEGERERASYNSRTSLSRWEDYSSDAPTPSLPTFRRSSRSPAPLNALDNIDTRRIADVVVVKNLNLTLPTVQIQALELIRGKRIFSRTAVHTAPKRFLFISLQASGSPKLVPHLNDRFFISHTHAAEDGLPNLEEVQQQNAINNGYDSDAASESSVIRSPTASGFLKHPSPPSISQPLFPKHAIDELTTLAAAVTLTAEIRAHLHNIPIFMRQHRAVRGGVSSLATRHLRALVCALAPLHGIDYVSPGLVALAARKVYPHRIVLVERAEDERSVRWGSEVDAVGGLLEGVTVGDVIEETIGEVEVPL